MNGRIKIRIGDIEVEYEGSEAFIKDELVELASSLGALRLEYAHVQPPEAESPAAGAGRSVARPLERTVSSIAQVLRVGTGREMVLAAAAHLTFAERRESFTRRQLLDDMRTASAYYKASYASNLTSYLRKLVRDGDLCESAADTYALSAGKREVLEGQLAD